MAFLIVNFLDFSAWKHIEASGISSLVTNKKGKTVKGGGWPYVRVYIYMYCMYCTVCIYIYMSYDYNSLYICIYITWSNLISFHIFLESCKLNNGYQRNLIQQFEFRVTQYGNPILNIICKKGRTRSWEEPFRCKKVFGLQHHLCLAQRWNHPGFGKEMSSWLVEGLSPWLTCHSPYISWVIQPTYI